MKTEHVQMDPLLLVSILGMAILAGILVLLIISRQPNGYRFVDNLMSLSRDGVMRADPKQFAYMGSFFFTCLWGTIMVLNHEMTDTFIGLFMGAWAAVVTANAAIKAWGKDQPPQQPPTEEQSK